MQEVFVNLNLYKPKEKYLCIPNPKAGYLNTRKVLLRQVLLYLYFLYARLKMGRIMLLSMAGGRAGGRPHRFPHNNCSSVYRIFTKLGHMIPLWKGKNPIYFGVIRSKVKVTVTINRFLTTGSFLHDKFSSVY